MTLARRAPWRPRVALEVEMKGWVPLLAVLVASVPTVLSASTVSIDISLGSGTTITGGPANTNVSWKDTSTGATASATTNGSGKASMPTANGSGFDGYTVTVGGETWSNLKLGGNVNIISDFEKVPTPHVRQNGFGSFFDVFIELDTLPAPSKGGHSYNTFNIINTGPNAYYISNLQLYTGLDLADFTTAAFDTPAAIATGSLYDDVSGRLGPGVLAPGGAISLSAALTPDASYALWFSTLQQVLPSGGLGPPGLVAFGGTVVPEPASWATLVAGLFGLGSALRRSRRARRDRTLVGDDAACHDSPMLYAASALTNNNGPFRVDGHFAR
jgi:hypothetical protein